MIPFAYKIYHTNLIYNFHLLIIFYHRVINEDKSSIAIYFTKTSISGFQKFCFAARFVQFDLEVINSIVCRMFFKSCQKTNDAKRVEKVGIFLLKYLAKPSFVFSEFETCVR